MWNTRTSVWYSQKLNTILWVPMSFSHSRMFRFAFYSETTKFFPSLSSQSTLWVQWLKPLSLSVLSNSPTRLFIGQSRNCAFARYILRPGADHTPRSQAWGVPTLGSTLGLLQKEACHEAPSCPHPATLGESANLYFHSTLSQDLGHILVWTQSLSWGSLVFARVAPSPLTAAPGAQLKPRAYPLSAPARKCQTPSRLRVLVGVSAVQFLFKIRKNLQKNLQILVRNFCALWLDYAETFIFQPKPGNTFNWRNSFSVLANSSYLLIGGGIIPTTLHNRRTLSVSLIFCM